MVWKWITGKNGKPTKPPFQGRAPSRHASSTDPATWCDLDTAMRAYCSGKCDGIGFALNASGVGAFDVDHCRDATTGAIHPWAQELVRRCGSYAESLRAALESALSGLPAALRCTASLQCPKPMA